MELQKKIANTKNMDYDTAEAIKELLEQGPNHEWLNGLYICLNLISNSRKKADSLLWRPDLCPQGTDNKDVIVLLEHLFTNLIDMKLQKEIANAKNMDCDAAEAIKELLKQGPREVKKDLMDWEVEEFEEENILFYKGKNYMAIDAELRRKIV
jgi:hypothetical protein